MAPMHLEEAHGQSWIRMGLSQNLAIAVNCGCFGLTFSIWTSWFLDHLDRAKIPKSEAFLQGSHILRSDLESTTSEEGETFCITFCKNPHSSS